MTLFLFSAHIEEAKSPYHVWLGGRADSARGAFYWLSDNYPVDNTLFHPGEPNASIYTRDRKGFDDWECYRKHYPFCRLNKGV